MKSNSRYTRATNNCVDFVVKLYTRIPQAKDWIIRNLRDMKWVENTLKDN